MYFKSATERKQANKHMEYLLDEKNLEKSKSGKGIAHKYYMLYLVYKYV